MVNCSAHRTDRLFQALSDSTRRQIVMDLRRGERTVGELATAFPLSLVGVYKHVRVLERAGIAATRRVGRTRVCRLVPGACQPLADWCLRAEAVWLDELAQVERVALSSEDARRRKRSKTSGSPSPSVP